MAAGSATPAAAPRRRIDTGRLVVWGGFFLAMSYFGTDQSQVQRYLTTVGECAQAALAGGSIMIFRRDLLLHAFDPQHARAIGLPAGMKVEGRGVGGSVEAELVSGVTLKVGSMTFKDMTVAVMDMAPVARAIGHPITVIIGRELFNSAVVSIDWSAGRLRLSAPDRFSPSSDRP